MRVSRALLTQTSLFLLLLLPLLACSLTRTPPTQVPTNTPVPLLLPTTPPLAFTTPGLTGSSPNPDCAITPVNWVAYTVQPGDSLGALSAAVDTPIQDIVSYNCLENADTLFIDQVLYLPRFP